MQESADFSSVPGGEPTIPVTSSLEERIQLRCAELVTTTDPAVAQVLALELRILTHLYIEELFLRLEPAA